MPLTIAIDGPVGAGKSTISDAVADRLGILHLDTGAMYRAVGLAAMESGIDPRSEDAVCRLCEAGKAQVSVRYVDGHQITLLNGRDVSQLIRTPDASSAASAVSRYQAVRKMMVRRQREIAGEQSILLDGRDIGTVVLPHATVKIFLTATPEARAARRMAQLREKGDQTPFEEVLAAVNARDHQDTTREIDPLRQAEDAVLVDSSHLSFDETVDAILAIVEASHDR